MGFNLPVLNRRRRYLTSAFSPASLFAASEPGGWYDPSDLSTLFQDSAGTTPVTAAGQSVGLWLDKSQGLALGAELVTNGDFSQGSTGWTLGSGWSVSGGQLVATSVAFGVEAKQAIGSLVSGARYVVTFTVTVTSGTLKVNLGDLGVSATELLVSASGTYTYRPARSGAAQITFWAATTFTGTIDNISVRELPGNHLTQSSLSNRPIYGIEPFGGRRNLLTYTEQFDNAVWTKFQTSISANVSTAPDGTTTAEKFVPSVVNDRHYTFGAAFSDAATKTASFYLKQDGYSRARILVGAAAATEGFYADVDLSAGTIGAATVAAGSYTATGSSITPVGNGWFRCTVSGTTPASPHVAYIVALNNSGVASFAGDGTSGILIWGAQLETGSTATAYQRVVTAFDVTQAGVPSLSYIQFDGSDDGYVSPTITPGIDKAQVFAGVRKLSDAAAGTVMDLNGTTGTGSIMLRAPQTNAANYAFYSGGSIAFEGALSPNGYPAPITNVVTGIGDIAADTNILRLNGTQVGSSASDQGTGNYSTLPMYVGRRQGTALALNGRIYSLIVRFGANLSASTITQTENWVAGKTGIYTVDQLNRLNAQTADGTLYSAYAASDAESNNYLVNNTVLAADGTSYNVI